MPEESRVLFWAKMRKTPPILVVHDSGRGEMSRVLERRGSGVVYTKDRDGRRKYKLLPRYTSKSGVESAIMNLKDITANPNMTPEELMQGLMTDTPDAEYVKDYSDWMVKRCILAGSGLPFFVGYAGKLNLLNPEALALYQAGEMFVKTEDKTLFDPRDKQPTGVIPTAGKHYEPLMLLDPRKIKEIISAGFDEAQMSVVIADSEEIGRGLRGGFKLGGIGIIIVIIIMVIALIFFLPQLGAM